MTKDTILFMCSPDIHRLNARRAISSVKATDLKRAELYVIDNAFDAGFNHSVVMNDMLRHAVRTKRNVVILDDDVEIYAYDWLDRLYRASDDLAADIVGCVHQNDHGHINHMGEVVYQDGLTESIFDFTHDAQYVKNNATYVPTLCSAILLIRNCHRYTIDVSYKKYKQDLDVCMQAWAQGQKVGIVLDLRLIHNRGFTGDRNPNYARILSEDSATFAKRWVPFLDRLYAIPELQQYRTPGPVTNWHHLFWRASRYRYIDPEMAKAVYQRIVSECFEPVVLAGAHYHLYSLTGDLQHLIRCNQINPCHKMARQQIEAAGAQASRRCDHTLDCRDCRFSSPQ
jgi:hypothetical protein